MKKLKSFFIKNKLFRMWFAYYIILLISVVAIQSIGYFTLMNRYQKEIRHSNELNLTHIQLLTENVLSEAATLASSLTSNSDLLQIADMKAFTAEDRIHLMSVCKSMLSQPLLSNNITNYYVYFKNSDYIVSPLCATDAKNSLLSLHSDAPVDTELMSELFNKVHSCSFVALPTVQQLSSPSLACIKTLITNPDNTPSVTAVILINTDKLRTSIKSAMTTYGGDIVIHDKSGELMFSTYDTEKPKTDDMLASTTVSSGSDRTYKSIIPKTALFKQFQYTQRLVMIIMLFAFILGVVLSLYFAVKNYTPIVEIENLIHSNTSKFHISSYDALSFIKNAFLSLLSENNKSGINPQLIQNGFFQQLYSGQLRDTGEISKAFEYFDIPPITDSFCVAVFFIDDYSGFSNENFPSEKNVTLGNFAIKNMLSELSEGYEYIISEVNSVVTVLYKLKNAEQRAELLSFLSEFKNTVKRTVSLTVSASLSDFHENPGEYSEAFSQAAAFYESSVFPPSGNIISQISTAKSDYIFPSQLQSSLSDAVTSGNSEKAILLIDEIITENIKNQISSAALTLLLRNILSILTYITKASDFPTPVIPQDFVNHTVTSVYHLNNVKKEMFALIKEMCFYSSKSTKTASTETLSEQIKAYLNENYHDINISVNYLGDIFGYSRNYIAKTFKAETKTALTDYIHLVRIEKAKELLKNSDYTISKIAELSGYTNDNTFTRIFKKYECVTPGQYRAVKNI